MTKWIVKFVVANQEFFSAPVEKDEAERLQTVVQSRVGMVSDVELFELCDETMSRFAHALACIYSDEYQSLLNEAEDTDALTRSMLRHRAAIAGDKASLYEARA